MLLYLIVAKQAPTVGLPPTVVGLLIVVDHLRRRFARFKLGAHLLQARGKSWCRLAKSSRSGNKFGS